MAGGHLNQHAIILTSDAGYLPGATALFNGLALYGNDVDVHFLPTPDVPPAYLAQLPDNYTVVDWQTLPLEYVRGDTERGLPWQVRFFRYWYAAQICPNYQSIMIMDSDAMVVGNLMDPLVHTGRTGELSMIKNPTGRPVETELKNIYKANHPAFHSHCATFNGERHRRVLGTVFECGLSTAFGDMVVLHHVLAQNHQDFSRINALPNTLWCHTCWWHRPVSCELRPDVLPELRIDGQRQIVVHGKWFNPKYLEQELLRLSVVTTDAARKNLELYAQVYAWLNVSGPVHLLEAAA